MTDYGELVADLRALAELSGSPAVEANSAAFTAAADAIETLWTQLEYAQDAIKGLRAALEAERESLRLAADEGLKPW